MLPDLAVNTLPARLSCHPFVSPLNLMLGTGTLGQELRTLIALAEDLDSNSSTYSMLEVSQLS